MNVMLNDISHDLNTTAGVQVVITCFSSSWRSMIPGGKLTDKWGRKRLFTIGLSCIARRPDCAAAPGTVYCSSARSSKA
jgi:MFS family permease